MIIKSNSIPEINGEAFKNSRENKKLTEKELADKLCLSHRHITQIEKNEYAVFFSIKHRHQVAKKVATYLGLSEEEAFIQLPILGMESSQNASTNSDTREEAPLTAELSYKNNALQRDQESHQFNQAINDVLLTSKKHLSSNKKIFPIFLWIGTGFGCLSLLTIAYTQLAPTIQPEDQGLAEGKQALIQKTKNLEKPQLSQTAPHSTSTTDNCQNKHQNIYQFTNQNPDKPANYVYVTSKENRVSLCVIDSKNTVTRVDLEVGKSKSIYGVPPFVLLADHFDDVNIFYQGNKVIGFPTGLKAIQLISNKND